MHSTLLQPGVCGKSSARRERSSARVGGRSLTRAAAADGKGAVSVAESLSWPVWLRPAAQDETDAAPKPAAGSPSLGFERVKSLGQAGIVSYVAVEAAFWAVAAPLGAFLASQTQDSENAQGILVGGAVVFLNVVRLFTPLKVGAAVLLAPTVERLLAGGGRVDVAALKEELRAAAGVKNGTDRSAAQREAISALVERLAAANPTREPAKMDIRNSIWELVYTNSSGNSSGKIAYLVGRVTQVFDADAGYANVVSLGPLEVRLEASYTVKSGKALVVQFESIGVRVFGKQLFSKPFPTPKPRGNWQMLYADADTRALLVPETGNVFVLRKME